MKKRRESLIIRDFNNNDKEEYFKMSKAFYNTDATIEKGNTDQFDLTFKQVLRRSPYVRGIMVCEDNKVVGYALLGFFWCNGNESITILIDELYIKQEYRGKGYASAFFMWLEETYDLEEYSFTLEVNPRNEKAKHFYEKIGYKKTKYIVMEKV